jgi:hypothetical protein
VSIASRRLVATIGFAAALMTGALAPVGVGAAGGSVDLDQWASLDVYWQNGNLNGNNSRYPEGGIIPFRLAIEGLSPGNHSIHINYDFTAGGHKAYDFLASWNGWRSPNLCSMSGGAISSMCPGLPGSSSRAFPSDPYVANGLSVSTAEVYSGVGRRLTIWGGAITSISGPVHAGSVNGNSTADFLVRFRATGSAVLLAWGGHLAQSAYWDLAAGGPRDGSGEVSGAPWHMRTLQLDGTGNKNQDRSIQPSAIVGELPPFALAPTPPPNGGGGGGGGSNPGPGSNPNTPGNRPGGRNPTPPPTSTDPAEVVGRMASGGELLVSLWLVAAFIGLATSAGWRRRHGRRRTPGR